MTANKNLTAREALAILEPEPAEEIIKSDLELWSGGWTWVDAEYDEKLREVLGLGFVRLVDALIAGTFHATGYRGPVVPESQMEDIPSHLWKVLELDQDGKAASGGGLEYFGLEFHEDTGPATSDPELPLRPNSERAYKERVTKFRETKGRAPSVAEDEKWHVKRGIPRDKMRQLRREHLTDEEKKPGNRPKNR